MFGHTEKQKTKATFNLDEGLHTRLKVRSALEKRDMVQVVTDAITEYLETPLEARRRGERWVRGKMIV